MKAPRASGGLGRGGSWLQGRTRGARGRRLAVLGKQHGARDGSAGRGRCLDGLQLAGTALARLGDGRRRGVGGRGSSQRHEQVRRRHGCLGERRRLHGSPAWQAWRSLQGDRARRSCSVGGARLAPAVGLAEHGALPLAGRRLEHAVLGRSGRLGGGVGGCGQALGLALSARRVAQGLLERGAEELEGLDGRRRRRRRVLGTGRVGHLGCYCGGGHWLGLVREKYRTKRVLALAALRPRVSRLDAVSSSGVGGGSGDGRARKQNSRFGMPMANAALASCFRP